jgi:hypothetical protein
MHASIIIEENSDENSIRKGIDRNASASIDKVVTFTPVISAKSQPVDAMCLPLLGGQAMNNPSGDQ